MPAVFPSLISTASLPAKGTFSIHFHLIITEGCLSVLEYLNREDADRAVRELDGKELRGRPVRVALDDSVCILDYFYFFADFFSSVAGVQIIIGAMTAGTTAIEMTATGTTDIDGTAPGHLLAAPNMTIVDPGLRPPRGRIMIKGLQGTMITGEEAMMTADPLITIMTVAGMILTVVGTTEDVKRRTIDTTIGRDMQMVKVVGLVESSWAWTAGPMRVVKIGRLA